MDVYIFLLCYNESVLLPHTIQHYRNYIPNCIITIYDNMSTDNSVEIAKSLGCYVIYFESNGLNDIKQSNIKNTCFQHVKNGWIICADMDEWLCITTDELYNEYLNGTTILNIKGVNMIGTSKSLLLDDINLHALNKGVNYSFESKKMCFLVPSIKSVKYSLGAHSAKFNGDIKYSKKIYINKHMECLGLNYYLNKKINRNKRTSIKKSDNLKISFMNIFIKNILYSSNLNNHKKTYLNFCKKSKNINESNDKKIIELFIRLFIQLIL